MEALEFGPYNILDFGWLYKRTVSNYFSMSYPSVFIYDHFGPFPFGG